MNCLAFLNYRAYAASEVVSIWNQNPTDPHQSTDLSLRCTRLCIMQTSLLLLFYFGRLFLMSSLMYGHRSR